MRRSGNGENYEEGVESYNGQQILDAEPKLTPEELVQLFVCSLAAISGTSAFGVPIIFAVLVNGIRQPKFYFSESTVETFVAVSWLMFVCALGWAGTTAVDFHLESKLIESKWTKMNVSEQRWITRKWYARTFLSFLLLFAANFFLSLVVMSYVRPVGYIGIGLAFGIFFYSVSKRRQS